MPKQHPSPSDADDAGDKKPSSPLDETVQIPNSSNHDTDYGDDNASGPRSGDRESTGHSTLIPDGTPPAPIKGDASDDLDATVNLETTVHATDGGLSGDDSADKTIPMSDLDQTVQIDRDRPSTSDTPTVRAGRTGMLGDSTDKLADPTDETTVASIAAINEMTVAIGDSVMASENLGQTINPRELSAEETRLWNSAAGLTSASDRSSFAEPGPAKGTVVSRGSEASRGSESSRGSEVSPVKQSTRKDRESNLERSRAIDRTFSEKHFARLRKCDLAKSIDDPQVRSDYRLKRKLGQGGMGDVYLAQQRSLDRLLALKVIKPLDQKKRQQLMKTGRLESVEDERRMQFLAEAIITGDLDHPNIVPVHDVALTPENELFYSMKRVTGTPWSEVMSEKSLDENLEILLRVCDAIGFAHERGVVHRDIKPENIMLGDYGVVMVMDWGLALPTGQYDDEKRESILATSGLGGTPAFMSPEMAIGPVHKIGPSADIYLLGATLYMIITGHAPHKARNVTECLLAVRSNKIVTPEEKHHGELLDIALRAMETAPEDRYPKVSELQSAIRDYRLHNTSIGQTVRAEEHLEQGQESLDYAEFARATFGFEGAIESWSENERARQGLAAATLAHAEAAYQNGDLELGLSLLDAKNPDHTELISRLAQVVDERESRKRSLAIAKKAAAAMLAFILIGGSIAMYLIVQSERKAVAQKNLAEKEKRVADEERRKAQEQTGIAERAKEAAQDALELAESEKKKAVDARSDAEIQKGIAEDQTKIAKKETARAEEKAQEAEASAKLAKIAKEKEETQRKLAEQEQEKAVYEAYVSKIGLAKTALEANDGDNARRLLKELKPSPHSDSWEWRWLWQQATESTADSRADSAMIDFDTGPSGTRGAIAFDDGSVELVRFTSNGTTIARKQIDPAQIRGEKATTVAISLDEKRLAVGTASGAIFILGPSGDRRVGASHTRSITDLKFAGDGVLISGSQDRTVRAWDTSTGQEWTRAQACWHLSPVRQIAVARQGTAITVAVACADERSGRVALWRLTPGDGEVKRLGTFQGHSATVSSIALDRTGTIAASGDESGNVLIWKSTSLEPVDYAVTVQQALSRIKSESGKQLSAPEQSNQIPFDRLVDDQSEQRRQYVSASRVNPKNNQAVLPRAHTDVVKTIEFTDDGETIVTGSDDYTSKIWDVPGRRLETTLRGHGGWVVGAQFLAGRSDAVASVSNDQTIRTWHPANYRGSAVANQLTSLDPPDPKSKAIRVGQAHQYEIAAARFSPDGTRIITASRDHTARIVQVNPESLAFEKTVELVDDLPEDELLDEGTSFVAMSMQLDRTARHLFIGSADATIRFWDVQRGIELGEVRGTGLSDTLAVSENGRFLLSGSSSPQVKAKFWQIDPSGNRPPILRWPLGGHQETVTAMAISPDASVLFTGDRIGFGLLWDAATGKRIGEPINDVRGFRINAAEFSGDGKTLYLGSHDEQLTAIDVSSRRRVGRWNHDGFVTRISVARDGSKAVTVSELIRKTSVTTTARHWNLQTNRSTLLDEVSYRLSDSDDSPQQDRIRITSAKITADGQRVTVARSASGGRAAEIRSWRIDSIEGAAKPDRIDAIPQSLRSAEVVLPIGDWAVVSMNEDGAFRWELEDGKLQKSYRSHGALTQAGFSADGMFAVTASRSVKIWDAQSGKAMAKMEAPHSGPVRTVAFDHRLGANNGPIDAGRFATAGDDGWIRLWRWNPQNQRIDPLGEIEMPGGSGVHRICFAKASDRLLAVGERGSAVVLDLASAKPLWQTNTPDAGDFVSAAFSPDDSFAIIGSTDHQVRIWNLDHPAQVEPVSILEGHGDTVTDVTAIGASPADLRIFTASSDDSAKVWDPRLEDAARVPGREIISLRRHLGDVNAIDMDQNGKLLMTAGRDGQVILWPASEPRN